jgi:putative sugar O-methyltransferase
MSLISKILTRLAKAATIADQRLTQLVTSSSIAESDVGYLDICREAVNEAKIFSKFRSDPRYQTILEHVTPELGAQYLDLVAPELKSDYSLNQAAKNDLFGSPLLMEVRGNIKLSPTTLRYLKVASDLQKYFGSLDGARVAEIGIGYGGQCRVLDELHAISKYTLVDLRPVLQLADRYLGQFPLRTAVEYKTMNELQPAQYDLVISNYAFTELRREIQDRYLEKILSNARCGYITYNNLTPPEFRSYSKSELIGILGATVYPEIPLTHEHNCILTWGTSAQ